MKRSLMILVFGLLIASIVHGQPDSAYAESDILLPTPSGNIVGTLIVPKAPVSSTVVLFISGSGPTDRNGNNPMMKNDALKRLAQALGARGIASVRYDKRGIGASSQKSIHENELRFDDYVSDASGWIKLLREEKQFKQVILAGHSEGSLVGMGTMEKPDKFISISGAGFPASEILKKQLASQPPLIKNRCYTIIDSLRSGILVDSIPPYLNALFRPSVQPYLISWFRHDPAAEIKNLSFPILIIQGKNDLQVSEEDALRLKQFQPKASLLLVDSMNHVLRKVSPERKENLKSYFDPSLPLAEELIPAIVDFISKDQ